METAGVARDVKILGTHGGGSGCDFWPMRKPTPNLKICTTPAKIRDAAYTMRYKLAHMNFHRSHFISYSCERNCRKLGLLWLCVLVISTVSSCVMAKYNVPYALVYLGALIALGAAVTSAAKS